MKASAAHFTDIQKPFTFYGLPPRALGCFFVVFFALWVGLDSVVAIDSAIRSVLLPGLLVFAVLGLIMIIRLNGKDPHFETVFILPFSFWRLSNRRRQLLCGPDPSPRKRLGEKKGGGK